jgi:protein ImuB
MGGQEPATRVLALWSPDWPVTAAAMAAHVPAHRPTAVVEAGRVLACSALARSQGVRRGLRRREAQARCPDLAVLDRDPDRDARAFEPVVVAVEELAPGVEVVRPGLVALPAQGPAGWFGGELTAAEALVDRVAARTGVECQVGVADGLFAAVLAARRGLAVAPGDTPAFLAPLGVEELDREPDVDRSGLVGLLRRLGLRSLGAFAALDPEDVGSRFGADAVLCHRLTRGLDPRPPVRRIPPEELTAEAELDPPVDRVDAAAFAARGLAERLHRTLASHGLSCTRLGVGARTVAGEELHRIWRCAEPLTPSGTVDRLRWQLDAWLSRGGTGALERLWLVPEETVTAGALQLGLWGDVGESDERAARALVRVQALLGPESVVTAVLVGGRDPAEQIRLVPWGDDRGLGLTAPPVQPGAGDPVGPEPPREREEGLRAVPAGHTSTPASAPVHRASADPEERVRCCREAGRGPRPGAENGLAARGVSGTGPGEAGPGPGCCRRPGTGGEPGPGRARHEVEVEVARPVPGGGGVRGVGGGRPGPVGGTARPPAAPAGWPDDVIRRTGRVPVVGPGAEGERRRSTNRRRRVPTLRRSVGPAAVPDPPPTWPGRLPAPSPAVVPPQPLPAVLADAAGRPVQLTSPDTLSAPPHRVVVDGGTPQPVTGWTGLWPVLQRWWAPEAVGASRLQVTVPGGALLLLAREGRWWVIGVYD